MKTLGSHGRFWSWGVSIIFGRSSWQPVSRTASRKGTGGSETSQEPAPLEQAGEAEAMEMEREASSKYMHASPGLCLSRRKLDQQTDSSEIKGKRERTPTTHHPPY